MSQSKSKRAEWQCPICDRTFRLPAGNSRPKMCRECAADCEAAVDSEPASLAKSGPLDDMPSSGSPGRRPPKRRTATRPDPPFRSPVESTASTADGLAGREDQEKVLEYLANISRSMTFFRRLFWGLVIMMLLNVVLMGAGVFYAIYQIKSLNNIGGLRGNLQLPGGGQNGAGQAGQLEKALEQLGEAARVREELLDEALGN